ncbi:protein FAM76A-like [Halichondria panicea]|uniref:protein FAM76A-like n=1 Tax=Halichondria panicea TaxID=6063 RepID=UPI00312B4CAE
MASNSDKSQMLFACTKCHRRCKFEDLSANQQLCKSCRKQFPLVTCTYCRLEFHPVKSSTDGDSRPACEHCAREFKEHGTPSFCSICNLQSAFTGKKCSRCSRSEKKYGNPIPCEDCKLKCAFAKPEDVKQKVDGKSLCLLCTINFKKAQFKRKSIAEQKGTSNSTSSHSSATGTKHNRVKSKHSIRHKDKDKDGESSFKKIKLDRFSSTQTAPVTSHHLSILGSHSPSMDTVLSSNHMLETEKLQNEISSLKKQLAQKEQTVLEKDKQICQLRAEVGEKDREVRIKLQDKQKSHTETIETLQTEIRGLRKQLSQSTQKKSSSSTAVSSQNSIIASLTSSLSATPVNSSS